MATNDDALAESHSEEFSAQQHENVIKLDALIVGAGFGGVYQLKMLRDEGFNVKLVEAGTGYGGVWHWNRYPGARVDIPIPQYEFSDPALWSDWVWKQRFPGGEELRNYFDYVAEKWKLRQDTIFEQFVDTACWDEAKQQWAISTKQGLKFEARYVLFNTGFAAKRHFPDWKGLGSFKGPWIHPSYWPADEPELAGKRVAVIGTGSTGVQLVQALTKVAGELVVFQRTPNLANPMKQIECQGREQLMPKDQYAELFDELPQHFGGIMMDFLPTATFDHTPQEREALYKELWRKGDFSFWLATYYDMLFSPEANTAAYNFWRDKTRERVHDERLKDKLAPMEKPHAFGCKRVSLEQGYFEAYNQPHVHLVDVNETPVVEVTEHGITTTEKAWDFDFVISATGFDSVTGGLLQMGIRGRKSVSLEEKWSSGLATYMGMAVAGFPNMFFTYGPQAPTALCNGPMCAELQGTWIIDVMKSMRTNERQTIEASEESEAAWAEETVKLADASLIPTANSWYMGDNIPGKRREPLIYLGGVPNYCRRLRECAADGYAGFHLS